MDGQVSLLKKLFDDNRSLACRLHDLGSVVQNPDPLTEEDLRSFLKAMNTLMWDLREWKRWVVSAREQDMIK